MYFSLYLIIHLHIYLLILNLFIILHILHHFITKSDALAAISYTCSNTAAEKHSHFTLSYRHISLFTTIHAHTHWLQLNIVPRFAKNTKMQTN